MALLSTLIIGAGRLWAARFRFFTTVRVLNRYFSRVKKLSEKGSSLELIEKAKTEAFTQVFNLNLEIASISYSV